MNTPTKQPDVIDLTRSIRDAHYQLLLDYQAMMLKVTALESENEDLKERLKQITEKIQLDI
jgi:chaperonin cofactor prefoldin